MYSVSTVTGYNERGEEIRVTRSTIDMTSESNIQETEYSHEVSIGGDGTKTELRLKNIRTLKVPTGNSCWGF